MSKESAPSTGLSFPFVFSNPDKHPYDEIRWDRRTAEITDDSGKTIFKQTNVEVPTSWSPLATKIAVSKYFYGDIAKGDNPENGGREHSIRQLIDRVVDTMTDWGYVDGYFSSLDDAIVFGNELKWLCVNQYGAFNSPVWFNVGLFQKYGVDGGQEGNYVYDEDLGVAKIHHNQYEHPQGSACFILKVEDTMESILDLAKSEAMLFKYGSGAGSDLSALRSTREKLSGGGKPSGPMSFLKIYDQVAGTVKSGGKTRRAAKMNTLRTSHPDIEEFIDAKSKEEKKAWALIGAGYDSSFNGEAYASVMYQNENLSVRATDEFMKAAIEGQSYWTRNVTDGKACEQKNASFLLRKIAEGTHLCGDPGMQFEDTIHKWHTCKGTGRQNSTNPCSEYLFLDDTACNLASLNLLKFKNDDGTFDVDRFQAACRIFITAQEILVDRASYPTKAIAENSHIFRTLGLGFANLGALLMSYGIGYDSDEGRSMAGAITALMTGTAYHQSTEMASVKGPFVGYHDARCSGVPNPIHTSNVTPMTDVIGDHCDAALRLFDETPESSVAFSIADAAMEIWESTHSTGHKHGFRNAQVTVLAPTGTIGFLMDCDTTGIEPAISLVAYKLLAGGGNLKIVNQSVAPALKTLGYDDKRIAQIIAHIDKYDTIEDVRVDNNTGLLPGTSGTTLESPLIPEHLPVFDCAFKAANGKRSLHYMGHLRMMAACQPFLSGAISKTVNLPEAATVDDIVDTYIEGWKLGLKAIAIYRDGSKRSAPLSTKSRKDDKIDDNTAEAVNSAEIEELKSYIKTLEEAHGEPVRKKLPDTRNSKTHKFEIAGHKGYLTVGMFEDGQPGEVFIQMSKEGSTIGGLMDTVATLTSISLQYGVPLESLIKKFAYQRFEPSGFTKNPDIRNATSIIDYVFRWLGCQFVPGYKEVPVVGTTIAQLTPEPKTPTVTSAKDPTAFLPDPCYNCGSSKVVRSGICGVCTECGTSAGCS
jgi:ribonucleoside-diphosphate reductase alpha chain